MKFITSIDLNKNELQNAVVQPLASAPSSPREGQIYYNSSEHKTYQYNGTSWIEIGTTDVLKFTAQTLTAEQKAQARANIGAGSAQGLTNVVGTAPINASTSEGTATISHATSGATAGTYGSAATASADAKLAKVTVNATGHVTSVEGVTITGSKYISELTSDAQAQINAKPDHADIPTGGTGTPAMDGTGAAGTAATWAHSDHVHPTDTSRQATITGAATTITSSNLTASRTLIANGDGKIAVSDVTSTELGYLDGVTSAIQTQLNSKQATISDLETIRSGAAAGATALQPAALNDYSTTTQMNTAIAAHHDSTKIDTSAKGANNGVATLGSDGKIPSSQLPSYVDDVLEYDSQASFPATGETGKIYIAKDTNKTYRWSGTAYVEISASLALGETSSTAYAGDKGKAVTDNLAAHVANTSNPHSVTAAQVGLGNVGNFKAVSTVASQGLSDTEKSNARANIGAGTSSFSGSYNDLSNKPDLKTVATTGDYDDLTDKPTITLNGSAVKSPSFYAPTSAGTSGQVLTSNGNGAPTWQAAPEAVHKYTATNAAISASGGAWTWTIAAATHGINNNAMFVAVYEVATGAQVVADIVVNATTYAITITMVGSGTLAAGTYKIVALG